MTVLNVVTFDAKATRKEEVVEFAKDILRRAEAGEFTDLSYAAATIDGSITSGFTATDDAPRRLSAVSRLLHRLHRMMDRQSFDD